jgi:hypothetical protein
MKSRGPGISSEPISIRSLAGLRYRDMGQGGIGSRVPGMPEMESMSIVVGMRIALSDKIAA